MANGGRENVVASENEPNEVWRKEENSPALFLVPKTTMEMVWMLWDG